VHLIDGGVSDNLALRAAGTAMLTIAQSPKNFAATGLNRVRRAGYQCRAAAGDRRVHWDILYCCVIPGASLTLPALLYRGCRGCATSPAFRGRSDMKIDYRTVALAACAAVIMAAPIAYAQVATTLEQAELAGLAPDKKAEVQTRLAQGGQTVSEVLQTILLNSIKLKHPASKIVALDFNRGIAVVQLADGKMSAVQFDTTTLAIKS
jgi:hypothetical protein